MKRHNYPLRLIWWLKRFDLKAKDFLSEAIGWYGAVAILLAYALLSFGVLPSVSLEYQLLNLTGALGIILISMKKNNYQPAALNAVWALVALMSILSLL